MAASDGVAVTAGAAEATEDDTVVDDNDREDERADVRDDTDEATEEETVVVEE